MCGVAGVFGAGNDYVDRVLRSIVHRGPDSGNSVQLESVGGCIGHRRLSIIDLSVRSDQPFMSPGGRYSFVYNGELYNYRELRGELQREGVKFRTTSDTEVAFEWLIRHGESGLSSLDGMFAFAFVDLEEQRLLLARDPLGEKPLYYSAAGDGTYFAFCSEIKGLLQLPQVDTRINEEALADYLRFLYTSPPHTFYEGIKELPPGHLMRVDLRTRAIAVRSYYDLEQRVNELDVQGFGEPLEAFRALLTDSVARRLQSDVPVSVYLSGGLDSSVIAAIAAGTRPEEALDTYTVRYPDAPHSDESGQALSIAKELGAASQLVDFTLALPVVSWADRLLEMFDQPFGNSTAIVAHELASTVAAKHRVALVGDGGDEVAVGYPRYKALLHHRLASRVPSVGIRLLSGTAGRLPRTDRGVLVSRRVQQFCDAAGLTPAEAFLRWSTYSSDVEVEHAMGPRAGRTAFVDSMTSLFQRNESDLHRAASLMDFASFVPYNLMQCADRTSMAASLEVRSPFLSTKLVEYALALPWDVRHRRGESKPLISRGFADILPGVVQNQPKRPFNPPVFRWLQRNSGILEEQLLGRGARLGELVDPGFVRSNVQVFKAGQRDNSTFLWGLLMLERWLRREQYVSSVDQRSELGWAVGR